MVLFFCNRRAKTSQRLPSTCKVLLLQGKSICPVRIHAATGVRPFKKETKSTPENPTYIFIWNIMFSPVAKLILFKFLIVLYNAAQGLGFVVVTSVFTSGPSSIELTRRKSFWRESDKDKPKLLQM